MGLTNSYVKDSASFIKEWKHITLEPEELLVSLDVVLLFTKIPIDGAIDVINRISD